MFSDDDHRREMTEMIAIVFMMGESTVEACSRILYSLLVRKKLIRIRISISPESFSRTSRFRFLLERGDILAANNMPLKLQGDPTDSDPWTGS
jgi:hypothetical protein